MMKLITLFSLVAVLPLVQAKAQNLVYDENAEIRQVASFKGIDAGGGMTVYLSQGKEQAVAVSADDSKYVSKIRTVVRNGVLQITVDGGAWNGWSWGNRKLKAYVTVTNLEEVHLHSAAAVRLADEIRVNSLQLDLSGASSFRGTVKGGTIRAEISGASVIDLKGAADVFAMEVSGASSVKAFDLTAATCSVEASGASSVSVTATKELKIEASGASSVGYKGTAVMKKIESSGASSIKKKDKK